VTSPPIKRCEAISVTSTEVITDAQRCVRVSGHSGACRYVAIPCRGIMQEVRDRVSDLIAALEMIADGRQDAQDLARHALDGDLAEYLRAQMEGETP